MQDFSRGNVEKEFEFNGIQIIAALEGGKKKVMQKSNARFPGLLMRIRPNPDQWFIAGTSYGWTAG